jgi:hypothetical protein
MPIVQRSWLSRNAQALVAAVVVVAASAVLLFAQDDTASGSTYTTDQAVTYQEFGGTIRNSGSGWYVIDDTGHTPDDITIGTVTSTSVRVNYPGCAEITSVMVGPDETYARDWGASFGPSVGLNYLVIAGSINDSSDSGTAQDVWDPTTDYTSSANIWIIGRCIPA